MKVMLCAALALLLAGCSINRGFSDQLPRLNSHSSKSTADYAKCLQARWAARGAAVQVKNGKDGQTRIYADDEKLRLRDRADLVQESGNTQILLYEIKHRPPHVPQYRQDAIDCL